MSTKKNIRKVVILAACLVLLALLASCVPKIKATTQKTEVWEGNKTLERVLATIADYQEGAKGQDVYSIDGEFEAYAGEAVFRLRVQAQFNTGSNKDIKNQLLLELYDEKANKLISGVYVRGDSIYVTAADFNLTLTKLDFMPLVAQALSSVMDMDIATMINGVNLAGMDISMILGGFLFPSAKVITDAPIRGQNGDTKIYVEATMDIDTVISLVLGVAPMVTDMVETSLGMDISAMLEEYTGTPLFGRTEEDETVVKGYIDLLNEYLDLEAGKPFSGSLLKMQFTNGNLDSFKFDGQYTTEKNTPDQSTLLFGFSIRYLEIVPGIINIEMPAFVSTFDVWSIRLTGEGLLPEVGEVDINVDIRLDSMDLSRNQIVFEIVKKHSREFVVGGYYYEGNIYLNLSQVDLFGYVNAEQLGLSHLKIPGLNLQQIMYSLVGELGHIVGDISEHGGVPAPGSGAVYGYDSGTGDGTAGGGTAAETGIPAITLDTSYLMNLIIENLSFENNRVNLDLSTGAIADLLREMGIEQVIDAYGKKALQGIEDATADMGINIDLDEIANAIGVDIGNIIDNLGTKVVNFIGGFDAGIGLSLFLPGVGLEILYKGQTWAYFDMELASIGDSGAVYKFPDNLAEYKEFDYGNIILTGSARLTNLGEVGYVFTVSNLDDINNLEMSWVTTDVNGAVLLGLYFSFIEKALYIDFGDEAAIVGFRLFDMNLGRIKVPFTELDLFAGISDEVAGIISGAAAQAGVATGEGDAEPASGLPASLGAILDFLDLLDVTPYDPNTGLAGVKLSNDTILAKLSELLGVAIPAAVEPYLPPAYAEAFADLFNLTFGFNLNYFDEQFGFDVDLLSLYIGEDIAAGRTKVVMPSETEKSTFVHVNELLANITLSGQVSLLGPNVKNLSYDLTLSGFVGDPSHMSISFEAFVASEPLFSVYYEQADKTIYLDLGLISVFGMGLVSMNIGQIKIPNIDIYGELRKLGIDLTGGRDGGLFTPVVSGASSGGTVQAAAAPAIGIDDFFGWIYGGYNDGVLEIHNEDDALISVLGKLLSQSIMEYITAKDILPPASVDVIFNTVRGRLGMPVGLSVSITLMKETMSLSMSNIAFASKRASKLAASEKPAYRTLEGLTSNIVISGKGSLPGVGNADYVLTVTGLNDMRNFAVSLETFLSDGSRNFSIYYVDSTIYIDFKSLQFFAFDPTLFGISRLKLTNINLFQTPAPAGGAVVASQDDTQAPFVFGSYTLRDIYDMLHLEYNEATGSFEALFDENSFVNIIVSVLTDAIYDQLGGNDPVNKGLLPYLRAYANADSVLGVIEAGLEFYDGRNMAYPNQAIGIALGNVYFGGAPAGQPGEASSYKTLRDLFGSFKISGAGYIPGAGDVAVEINVLIDIEDLSKSEFSFVASNKNGVALGLYNFDDKIYVNFAEFHYGEIDSENWFTDHFIIENINIGDILSGIIGSIMPFVNNVSDITPATQAWADGVLAAAADGSGSGTAAPLDFNAIYEALAVKMTLMNVQVAATPTIISEIVLIMLGLDLSAIINKVSPDLRLDVNLLDVLGIGFSLAFNYEESNGAITQRNEFIAFRVHNVAFGAATSYKHLGGDETYLVFSDLVDNFRIHTKIDMEIGVSLATNEATLNGLDNLLNHLLGAIDDENTGNIDTYGFLGNVSVKYPAVGIGYKYGITADVSLNRRDVKNTDILLEVRMLSDNNRLLFGFYVDDGVGYLDISGLLGVSDYTANGKGLRLAINEIDIQSIISKLFQQTADALPIPGGTGFARSAGTPSLDINVDKDLIQSILNLLATPPTAAPSLKFENFVIETDALYASGKVKVYGTEAKPQVTLDVKVNIDIDRNGIVNFGQFIANKNKYVLMNIKYGLGELAGILTILDSSLTGTTGTGDMFKGTLLIRNTESINAGKNDNRSESNPKTSGYHTGQTSDVYIFKISDTNMSGSEPFKQDFFNPSKGINAYSGLSGRLGILIDVKYNFTVKVPEVHLLATYSEVLFNLIKAGDRVGKAFPQGDLDMAYFFALSETSLDVYARIGGKIDISIVLEGAASSVGATIPEVPPIEMYQLISLASLDTINLRNITGGISLGAAGSIVGQAADEPVLPPADPMILNTNIHLGGKGTNVANRVDLEVIFDPVVLDKALVKFQNDLLGSLAPGETIDLATAPTAGRYVADKVWEGVKGMIVGFVMAEGAMNPGDDYSGNYANNPGKGITFWGAENNGKDDMQNFINALLPFPRLTASSRATLVLTFINGSLTDLEAYLGTPNAEADIVANKTKSLLYLKLARQGYTIVNNATAVSGTAPDQYATIDTFENIKNNVTVKYSNGISKQEPVSWDFSPIRQAIADGDLTKGGGVNRRFVLTGHAGHNGFIVNVVVYIVEGAHTFSYANEPPVYNVDPYNGNWRNDSTLPKAFTLDFQITSGGSGGITLWNVPVTWDVSGVNIYATGDYTAYIRWNGISAARTIHVEVPGTPKTIVSDNIPRTHFFVTNIGTPWPDESLATVTFGSGGTAVYPVTWDKSLFDNKSYGIITRTGTIETITQTYTISQTVTMIALATNHIEYRNNAQGATDGRLAVGDGSRIQFFDTDGIIRSSIVQSIDMGGTPLSIGHKSGNVTADGVTISGGYAGTMMIGVRFTPQGGTQQNITVPVDLSLGSSYTETQTSNSAPRANAGAYVDTSPAVNNVYKASIVQGSIITSKNMPTMVLRAAVYANLQIYGATGGGGLPFQMITAKGVPDITINWNFAPLNTNNPGVYRVTGTLYHKTLTTTVYCDITVTPPPPAA